MPPPSRGNLTFTADVATRWAQDGSVRADVYVELPYASLRFSHSGSEWTATSDITIVVYGRRNEQLTGDIWTVPLRSPVDPGTRDVEERVCRRRFELPVTPGRLRFEITVSQKDSGREGIWTYPLDVASPGEPRVTVSDFLFGLCVPDSVPEIADWGGDGFVPWTRRRYGNENPLLCVRGEVRDGLDRPDTTYRLTCQVLNAAGRSVQSWTEDVPRRDRTATFQLHPSTVDLSLGTYRLRVDARLGDEKGRRERYFEMDESRISLMDDPRMIRVVLGYVAKNDEILALEDLPEDSLQVFWNGFWERRDPTPGTTRNERLTEFLRRLEYVNQHFSILEPGWSSDMGRVYIRYGAPDEIDRTPYSSAGPPREVWYYAERQLRFVFLDTEGFGRFRLAGSGRE